MCDDGLGMTEEAIAKVLDLTENEAPEQTRSIGVRDVLRRIKTLFGEEYGVAIQSEIDEGTVVRMLLPAKQELP